MTAAIIMVITFFSLSLLLATLPLFVLYHYLKILLYDLQQSSEDVENKRVRSRSNDPLYHYQEPAILLGVFSVVSFLISAIALAIHFN